MSGKDSAQTGALTKRQSPESEDWRRTLAELRALCADSPQAQALLDELAAHLEHLARERDRNFDFADTLVHEMRSPVTVISGYADILLVDHLTDLNERQVRYLRKMRVGAERLGRLVNATLDLVRLEDRRLELALVSVELPAILNALANKVQPKLEERRQRLTMSLPPSLPPVYIDPDYLIYVLEEILDNAIYYTPPGGELTLAARVGQEQVVLSVRDTGIGFSPQEAARIGSLWWRARQRPVSAHPGHGLSIHLGSRLLQAMGGDLQWESAGQGQGATFRLLLPIYR